MNAASIMRIVAGMATLVPAAALAGQAAPGPLAPVETTPRPIPGEGPGADRGLDQASPVSEDDLARDRGGQTIVAANQTLSAVTSGNVLNGDYVAGPVILSDQALSNFNGIANIAINTGAQVSLQSGMNITINVAP